MQKISKNEKETAKIAKEFLGKILKKKYKEACVVGLYGDLGAGKTAFTKAVAKYLGVQKKINSPTFVIMKKYPVKARSHKFLFHLDAYRLKNSRELEALGWGEITANPEHLIFIEWPENVKKAMPKKHHQIHIAHTKEGYRRFKIKHA